MIPLEQQSL